MNNNSLPRRSSYTNLSFRNAPYVFGVRAAATAIATGNTTILKSSEMTPRCYWALGKILFEAGVPEGVINILHSPPKDNPRLITTMIQHPAIKKVNFTGSANVGRSIAAECGRNLKPCLLELGGKNSAIILPDADMQKAAQECLAGSFLNVSEKAAVHPLFAPNSITFRVTCYLSWTSCRVGSSPLHFAVWPDLHGYRSDYRPFFNRRHIPASA